MTLPADIAALGPEAHAAASVPPSVAMAEFLARNAAAQDAPTIGALLRDPPPAGRETLIFLIALIAVVPGASLPAGLALIVLSLPMIAGRTGVWLPRTIAARPVPLEPLRRLMARAMPLLRWQERNFTRSGPATLAVTRPFAAILLLALSAMLLVPLPLSNVAPALAIALIAVAYLEASAVLIAVSALTGLLALGLTGSVVWAALGGARALFG